MQAWAMPKLRYTQLQFTIALPNFKLLKNKHFFFKYFHRIHNILKKLK